MSVKSASRSPSSSRWRHGGGCRPRPSRGAPVPALTTDNRLALVPLGCGSQSKPSPETEIVPASPTAKYRSNMNTPERSSLVVGVIPCRQVPSDEWRSVAPPWHNATTDCPSCSNTLACAVVGNGCNRVHSVTGPPHTEWPTTDKPARTSSSQEIPLQQTGFIRSLPEEGSCIDSNLRGHQI